MSVLLRAEGTWPFGLALALAFHRGDRWALAAATGLCAAWEIGARALTYARSDRPPVATTPHDVVRASVAVSHVVVSQGLALGVASSAAAAAVVARSWDVRLFGFVAAVFVMRHLRDDAARAVPELAEADRPRWTHAMATITRFDGLPGASRDLTVWAAHAWARARLGPQG